MPCCVNGIYSSNFLLAHVGDSFSEGIGLKLKSTGMPDQKKTVKSFKKQEQLSLDCSKQRFI